jgi:hypothetical protein
MFCSICNIAKDDCRLTVIEGDTNCTLLTRRESETHEAFMDRYYGLVDSGRYPNMTTPLRECADCCKARNEEVEAELEYWRRKSGTYDDY